MICVSLIDCNTQKVGIFQLALFISFPLISKRYFLFHLSLELFLLPWLIDIILFCLNIEKSTWWRLNSGNIWWLWIVWNVDTTSPQLLNWLWISVVIIGWLWNGRGLHILDWLWIAIRINLLRNDRRLHILDWLWINIIRIGLLWNGGQILSAILFCLLICKNVICFSLLNLSTTWSICPLGSLNWHTTDST